ncbi:MAG: MATE family efflux transporter [Myxococcales bacterium]|nr:MATE family efflux transporter [Myxococcales bacterium]
MNPSSLDVYQRRRRLDADITRMAWPVIVSLLVVNAIELIDIAMLSRLGRDSVAAVGYSAQYVHLVVTSLQAVAIASVALMARSVGGGDLERARAAFAAGCSFSLCIAGVAVGIVWLAPEVPLGLLGATPSVSGLAIPYFRLVMTGTLLVALDSSIESAYRARKNTRVPLLAVIATGITKLALNLLLVFGLLGFPRLGLEGAGIATLAAHGTGLAVYWLARRTDTEPAEQRLTPSWSALRRHSRTLAEMARVAVPALGERLVMNVALLAYFSILSRSYGGAAIAAYAIGVRLLAFSWIPGLGFSVAAATLVGQALGRRDVDSARQAGWRSVRLALIVMACLGVAVAFLRGPLARGFTADTAILEDLVPFLLTLAMAQPFMGVHFTLSGALRGAGDTMTPFLGAALGNWLLRVPLAYYFATRGSSVVWVWSALVGDHIARSVWSVWAFRSGRWGRGFESATRGATTGELVR